jgi:hypothetical protein
MDSYPIVPVGGLAGLVMVSTGSVGDDGLTKALLPAPQAIAIDALVFAV